MAAVASTANPLMSQDAARVEQHSLTGTWSARASSGLTLMGGWTATPDTSGAVLGTWTLFDAQRNTVASGGWSAAKMSGQWNGAWRAIMTGRPGEYAGTWTAAIETDAQSSFVTLFEKAMELVINGTWRTGGYSGAWAIRTAPDSGGS
jgi:hypothetical protein